MVDNPLLRTTNLIKREAPPPVTHSFGAYKAAIFDIVTVASAVLAGYLYHRYIDHAVAFWMFGTSVAAFSVFSLLETVFVQSGTRRFFIVLLEIAGLIGFFWQQPVKALLTTATIGVVFFVWGGVTTRRELENSIHIHFFSIARSYYTKFVTAVILMGVLLYFPQWTKDNSFISERAFESVFDTGSAVVKNLVPGITIQAPFEATAADIARAEREKDPNFLGLSREVQDEIIQHDVQAISSNLEQTSGVAIQNTDMSSDVFYRLFVNYTNQLHDKYRDLFIVGWAIMIFFVVRGLGAVAMWGIAFIAFLVYELLIAAQFVQIVNTSTVQESIEFF